MSLSILASLKCLYTIEQDGYTRLEDWIIYQRSELRKEASQTLEKTAEEFQKQQQERLQPLIEYLLKDNPQNPLKAQIQGKPDDEKARIVQEYLSSNFQPPMPHLTSAEVSNPTLEMSETYFTYLTADDPLKMACEDKKNLTTKTKFISELIKHMRFYHIETEFSKMVKEHKFAEARAYLDKIPQEHRRKFLKITESGGKTMIFHAVEMDDENLLDEVLECFTKENFFPVLKLTSKSIGNNLRNPLQLAILKGNFDLVKKILDKIPEEKISELLQLRITESRAFVNNTTILQLAIIGASYLSSVNSFKILKELLLLLMKLPIDKQKEQLSANTLIKLSSLQSYRIRSGPAAENFQTPNKTKTLTAILDNISTDLQVHLLSAKDENGKLPIELFINLKNEEAVLKILEVINRFSDEDKKKCLYDCVLAALTGAGMKTALKNTFQILPYDQIVDGLKIKVDMRRDIASTATVKNCLGTALYCNNEAMALLVFKEILKLKDTDMKECISENSLRKAASKNMQRFTANLLAGLQTTDESKKILMSLLKHQILKNHPDYPSLTQSCNALNYAIDSDTDEKIALDILNIIKSLSEEDKKESILETTLFIAVYYNKLNIVKVIFEIASNDLIERSLYYHQGVNKKDGSPSFERGNVMQRAIQNADEDMIRLIWTKSQDLSEEIRAKLKADITDNENITDSQLKTLLKVVPVEIFEGNADKILKRTSFYVDKDKYNDAVSRVKTLLEAICKLEDADQKITKYFPLNWFNQNMQYFPEAKDFKGIFEMLPTKSRLSYMQHNYAQRNLLENACFSNTTLITMLLKEIEKLDNDKDKATCLFDEKKHQSAFFQLLHSHPEYLDDLLKVFNNLSDQVKLDWLRVKNRGTDKTALHYALGVYSHIRKEVVLKLIDAIPQANRREILLIENKNNKSAWDLADVLQNDILKKLSDDDQKMLLEKKDDRLSDSRTGKKARKENTDNSDSASSSSSSSISSSSSSAASSSVGKRRREEEVDE